MPMVIDKLFSLLGYIFIGGCDRDQNDIHYWLDDTLVEDYFTNWSSGQPNHGSSNHLATSHKNSWRWNDITMGHATYFLCEA